MATCESDHASRRSRRSRYNPRAMTGEAASARCRKCGRCSLLKRHFCRRRCPACQPHEYGWGESLGLILYGCGGGAALVWAVEGQDLLLVLLFLYALSLLLCVLHEATHALAAALVGWRVHFVGIGSGGVWRVIPVGRLVILLHRRPWSGAGFCGTGPRHAYSRRAIAAILAAPLAMHLVAAAAARLWAPPSAVARLFVALNLLAAVGNAWPRKLRQHVARATDGKLLLDLWCHPDLAREKWCRAGWVNPVAARLFARKFEEAFALAEQAVAANPGNETVLATFAGAAAATGRYGLALPHVPALAASEERARPSRVRALRDGDLAARGLLRGAELEDYVRGGILVGADRLDEVVDLSERRLAASSSEESRALWQACLALALLLSQRDLDRAEAGARYACERLPWVPFVETAWGMTRIERGDFEEGLAAFARTRKVDREGRMAWLQAAWSAVAGRRDLLPALEAPGAWPACRRRAERAL